MLWVLTWLASSAALAALTAAIVRLPGCRASAAARATAWALALVLSAGLTSAPLTAALVSGRTTPDSSEMRRPAGAPFVDPVVVPPSAQRWLVLLMWVWSAGSLGLLALVVRDVADVARLKRAARPFSPDEKRRLGPWLPLLSRGRAPRLCWCGELDVPAAIGFLDPVVALPDGRLARLTDEQLQHVVLHELAHVRRRDDWSVLAERTLVALMWVNPAAHWMRRRLAIAREMACDDWVVGRTASAAAYALSLTTVAELTALSRLPRLAAGIRGRHGSLGRRVARVLDLERRPPSPLARAVAGLVPIGVALAAAGLLQLPPVFVLEQTMTAPLAARAHEIGALAMGIPAALAFDPEQSQGAAARVRVVPTVPPAGRTAPDVEPASGDGVRADPAAAAPAPPPVSEADRGSLDAAPLPVLGAAAVTMPGAPPAAMLPRADADTRWWSGPAELGGATGDVAVTASRATASFFKRIGSSVPQLFNR
jgi:beta-lactamase regulating signal transducer with metallopeptidase domain